MHETEVGREGMELRLECLAVGFLHFKVQRGAWTRPIAVAAAAPAAAAAPTTGSCRRQRVRSLTILKLLRGMQQMGGDLIKEAKHVVHCTITDGSDRRRVLASTSAATAAATTTGQSHEG